MADEIVPPAGPDDDGDGGRIDDDDDRVADPSDDAAAKDGGEGVPRTIHDAFFKRLFGDPRNAASLLRAITPAVIAEHLDWTSLRAVQASVVQEGYRQNHGDLLFEARWKDHPDISRGHEAEADDGWQTGRGEANPGDARTEPAGADGRAVFLRINLEHQSTVDRWMALRGLDMTRGLWRRWRERHEGVRHLPVVLTYVFYHGASPWNAPTSLHELIAMPEAVREELAPYVPSFRVVLDDVRTTTDDALVARDMAPYPKLAIVLMKHGSARDVAEELARHGETLAALLGNPRGAILLESLLDYLWNVNDATSVNRLLRILSPRVGPELEKAMIPYAQKLRQEGMEDGRKLGLEDGLRELLLYQLVTRFHAVPGELRARIERATGDEVKRWATRILDAESLEDVFDAE